MIGIPPRILLACQAVDFRKQIDGLAAVCERELGAEPLDGTLFVFRNRRASALKCLVWSAGGFLLIYKKLERGYFAWPKGEGDTVVLTPAELLSLLEGLDLSGARRLQRWSPAKREPVG